MISPNRRITDLLDYYARATPFKEAFIYLTDGESQEEKISYRELDNRVGAYAKHLMELDICGNCALLIFSNVLEFIIAFLACQQQGVICVPVFYSSSRRYNSRLRQVLKDSQARYILCCASLQLQLEGALGDITDDHKPQLVTIAPFTSQGTVTDASYKPNRGELISFVQYTSGSTGDPKGVVITHQSLLVNQEQIKQTFGCDDSSVILSWLPFQHDMGLIGNILHSIYVGCTCVLFSPVHFMQRPQRWLAAISKYKVTHSGGPNFAYDLCVEKVTLTERSDLDLSSWKVAYNGSDFVKASTLLRFTSYFEIAGFNAASFYPCYGLAEATLLVTGAKRTGVKYDSTVYLRGGPKSDMGRLPTAEMVSCGTAAEGIDVKILSEAGLECCDGEEGEICIGGANVSSGYYRKDNSSYKVLINGVSYFRTGDLGFLEKSNLYVSGRIKEMLVVRGANVFPSDIEHHIMDNVPELAANGVVVFNLDEPAHERFVLIVELKRAGAFTVNFDDCLTRISRIAGAYLGIDLTDIVITHFNSIPKTTSGKIQRLKSRDMYLSNNFDVLASLNLGRKTGGNPDATDKYLKRLLAEPAPINIKTYLLNILSIKLGYSLDVNVADDTELTNLGLDSLRIVELVNQINSELSVNIDPHKIYLTNKLGTLILLIESMFWIKNRNVHRPEIEL